MRELFENRRFFKTEETKKHRVFFLSPVDMDEFENTAVLQRRENV